MTLLGGPIIIGLLEDALIVVDLSLEIGLVRGHAVLRGDVTSWVEPSWGVAVVLLDMHFIDD